MLSETALANLNYAHIKANQALVVPSQKSSDQYQPTAKLSVKTTSSISQRTNNRHTTPALIQMIAVINSLCRIQDEATALRVSFQQKRKALSRLRTKVASRDEKIMATIRKSIISGQDIQVEELSALYEASQQARDDLGSAEDDCEKMELELDQLEFELCLKGDKIRELHKQLDYDVTTEPSASEAGTSHISYETPSSVDRTELVPAYPLNTEVHVMNRITNPNSTQIRSKSDHSSDADARHPIQHLSPSKPELYSPIGIQDHQLPLKDSAPDPSVDQPWSLALPTSTVDIPQHVSDEEPDVLSKEIIDETSGILFLDGTEGSSAVLSDYLTRFDNKHSRINLWLLHKLRTSPAEIIRLQQAVVEQSSSLEDWQTHSLNVWEHDYPIYFTTTSYRTTDSLGSNEVFQPVLPEPVPYPLLPFPKERPKLITIDNHRRNSVTNSAPATIYDDCFEI
jgi:hypothetical protein